MDPGSGAPFNVKITLPVRLRVNLLFSGQEDSNEFYKVFVNRIGNKLFDLVLKNTRIDIRGQKENFNRAELTDQKIRSCGERVQINKVI